MNITNVPDKVALIREMCEGEARTAFVAGITASNLRSWRLLQEVTVNSEAPRDKTNGETKVAYEGRKVAACLSNQRSRTMISSKVFRLR
jgi:hypothetical protein